jgi:hypothetical protein
METLIVELKGQGYNEFEDWEIFEGELWVSSNVAWWIEENHPDCRFFCNVWVPM